jgi:hypothetical protein
MLQACGNSLLNVLSIMIWNVTSMRKLSSHLAEVSREGGFSRKHCLHTACVLLHREGIAFRGVLPRALLIDFWEKTNICAWLRAGWFAD